MRWKKNITTYLVMAIIGCFVSMFAYQPINSLDIQVSKIMNCCCSNTMCKCSLTTSCQCSINIRVEKTSETQYKSSLCEFSNSHLSLSSLSTKLFFNKPEHVDTKFRRLYKKNVEKKVEVETIVYRLDRPPQISYLYS